MSWQLPTSVELDGKQYSIHADYRDILCIMTHLADENLEQAALTAMYIFYEDFDSVPPSLYLEAYEAMNTFMRCGQPEDDGKPARKLIDWEQDSQMIVADVNKVAGCEVRALPFLHWYTFMGYFNAIGEGQLSSIVSIRKKRATGKKLEKWEQEFYQENKAQIEFKKAYTQEDQQLKEQLLKMLEE